MELDVTKGFFVVPLSGGGWNIEQIQQGNDRQFRRAFSTGDDMLNFLSDLMSMAAPK